MKSLTSIASCRIDQLEITFSDFPRAMYPIMSPLAGLINLEGLIFQMMAMYLTYLPLAGLVNLKRVDSWGTVLYLISHL